VAPTDVYGSVPGRVLTAATALTVVVLVASLVGEAPARDVVLAASLGGLAVLVVWAALGRPEVEVSDGTIVLRNVLQTVTIPWPTVVRTQADWSLVVHTTGGRFTAWAAPRSSGTVRALVRRRSDDVVAASGDPVPAGPGDGGRRRRPASAESVAAAIDGRLAVLRAAGHLDDAERAVAEHGLRPTVVWHRATIAGAVALALLAAATRLG